MPNPRDKTSHPKAADYPKEARSNRLHTRIYPPVDGCVGDVGQWIWRTRSVTYRRRIKRAVQAVQEYRLMTTGSTHITGSDRDVIHRLLDTLTFSNERRTRTDGGARDVLSS